MERFVLHRKFPNRVEVSEEAAGIDPSRSATYRRTWQQILLSAVVKLTIGLALALWAYSEVCSWDTSIRCVGWGHIGRIEGTIVPSWPKPQMGSVIIWISQVYRALINDSPLLVIDGLKVWTMDPKMVLDIPWLVLSAICFSTQMVGLCYEVCELWRELTTADPVSELLDTDPAWAGHLVTPTIRNKRRRVPRMATELADIAKLRHKPDEYPDTRENRIILYRYISDYAVAARRQKEPGFESIRTRDLKHVVMHALELYFIPTSDELELQNLYATREVEARRELDIRNPAPSL
jgi:hypothetical protein